MVTFPLDEPRQAKIGEMRFAASIDQNIPGLNISMQDPSLVGVGGSARQFDDEFRRTSIRHCLTLDCLIKALAFHKLHAEIARAVTFPNLMNWNDAGVVQTRCGLRFKAKPFNMRLRGPSPETHNF